MESQNLKTKFATGVYAFVLVLIVGLADYQVTPEMNLSIFYLLPVSLAAWFVGRHTGIWMSIVSMTVTVLANHTQFTPEQFSHILWNAASFSGVCIIVTFSLSSLKTAREHEAKLADEDFLTKVANLRSFLIVCSIEVNRARRYGHSITIIYLAMDQFRKINDRYGRMRGDSVLCSVAQMIKQNIRSTDTVARLGGDEFAILLPDTGYEQAKIVVEKVLADLKVLDKESGWPSMDSVRSCHSRRKVISSSLYNPHI